MRYIRAALRRLAGVITGHRADDDLREELQSHLEMETAENVRRGMPPDEAHRQALLASGGLTQAAEAVHDRRGLPWIENLVADTRYALRTLRHSPVFTAVVIITLALGIGANTAIFSVVRGVLLKPLPNREGDRLVYLRQSTDGPGGENITFSVPEVRDFRTGVPALAGIAEYSPWSSILQGDDDAVRISVGLVTGNYFEVMGLSPVLGRVTRPADDGPGAQPVVVLTYAYWMKRFGGDSGIVGQSLTLDKKSVTVIGVLQPAPFFPDRIDALLNMVNSSHHVSAMMVEGRSHRMTEMVARLAPGATRAAGQDRSGRGLRTNAERVQGGLRSRLALPRRRHPLSRRDRRARAAHPVALDGRRRVRPGDLRRQRRQPDPHARRAAGARAGRTGRTRRRGRRGCGGCCSWRTSSWPPWEAPWVWRSP